ncbi:hypothetical protein K501DRAFT_274423 [Backusella circina FSU 941]|nr:hypothetical protein K501DRAFT_274423 [Backusella circina FSU 941]
MSDPVTSQNVEQTVFTKEQVGAIIEAVTKRVRETQSWILTAPLNSKKTLQKFKRSIPKYNNGDWNTPESTNPNFVNQLKKWKIDSLQLVSTIYKLTENTRIRARAAAEIYESLQYITERGMQQEDAELYHNTMEKARRLAVFGFGTAKQQESKAKEATTKALKLKYSLKHLETPENGEKKYAFDKEFIEQYCDETFKKKVTGEANRANRTNNPSRGRGGFRGNGYRGGRPFLSNRGRGRDNWMGQRGDQPDNTHESSPNRANTNDNQ